MRGRVPRGARRRGPAADEGLGRRPRGRTGRRTRRGRDWRATTRRAPRRSRRSRRPASTSTRSRPATTATATSVHASDHTHPHVRTEGDEPPVVGIVGAGAVGTALGVALRRAGWPVKAVASRDAGAARAVPSLVEGSRAFAEATALMDEVELIIVAVPDDAVARVAGSLHMYGGQAMVHTSGALDASVLAPAMAAGTQVGSFHPLVAFADTERAVAALHGATDRDRGRRPAGGAARPDGRGRRRAAGPARARLEVGVSRRGGARGRRVRRAARRDRRAGPGRRARRGGLARDLRAADRADARQRPGAGDPGRADRPDHPRRPGDARSSPADAARPRARRRRPLRRRRGA